MTESSALKSWRNERTGWRDQALSERHGCWGFNCPGVDLDFVMLEYNYGKPCAIVEYKHHMAQRVNPGHPTYRALVELADGYASGPLPCFVARYNPEYWSFTVQPLNGAASDHYRNYANKEMSEQLFVKSLYYIRKKVLTEQDERAINQLNATTTFDEFDL